jgi:arsenate reductase
MAKVTIYHNPKCSKSRQTLALLQENGVDPEIIEYLKEPATLEELKEILKALGCPASTIVRTKEVEYDEAGLNSDSSELSILEAIVQYPKLLERPIVISDGRGVVGRPPENVQELI